MTETPRPESLIDPLVEIAAVTSGGLDRQVPRPDMHARELWDAARAAEHEQHQREIAQRDETIRQLLDILARVWSFDGVAAADLEPEAYEAWRSVSPVPVAPQEDRDV